MQETVGAGKGKPSAGDAEGRGGPDTQGLHEGGVQAEDGGQASMSSVSSSFSAWT